MKIFTKISLYLVLLFTLFISPSFASQQYFDTNLLAGSRGNKVGSLQEFLISKGLLLGVPTNYFGNQTKKAVQEFQKQNNINQTGNWFNITRQKANSLQETKVVSALSTQLASSSNLISSENIYSNKEVSITLSLNQGGNVFTLDNSMTCYNFETCKKNFPAGKKITFKAYPMEGYSLKGWSESSCGKLTECNVVLNTDTKISVNFGVAEKNVPTGKFVSPQGPTSTCYIALGRSKCDLAISWTKDSSVEFVVIDGERYFVSMSENADPNEPTEITSYEAANSIVPVYFPIAPGIRKISIKNNDTILDSVSVDVKCLPGLVWEGNMCWEKGANLLTIFKSQGAFIKSEPNGINCGYTPEKCSAGFSSNTSITLKAILKPGYVFDSWTGACTNKELTCIITMDKAKSVGVKLK